MKIDIAPFEQRFPWWGADLQTIATALLPVHQDNASPPAERLSFKLADGDMLLAMLDRPAAPSDATPLVVLLHGAPGSEDSRYIIRMSRYLLTKGHRVLRLNLRGAGPSRIVCGGQYSAASSADLRELLGLLPPDLTQGGVAAVGYSLGGAILLKYLGEEGTRTPLRAAATISAPIDLLGACRSLMSLRNMFYHFQVFKQLKREATAEGAVLSPRERESITASRTLWEYDDTFTARRNGFAGAADYYFHCSAIDFLAGIAIPTLVLAALDDPWVPGGVYSGHRWRSNELLCVSPLLQPHGGHVGFHGTGGGQPWSDVTVATFIAAQSGASPAAPKQVPNSHGQAVAPLAADASRAQ